MCVWEEFELVKRRLYQVYYCHPSGQLNKLEAKSLGAYYN